MATKTKAQLVKEKLELQKQINTVKNTPPKAPVCPPGYIAEWDVLSQTWVVSEEPKPAQPLLPAGYTCLWDSSVKNWKVVPSQWVPPVVKTTWFDRFKVWFMTH